MKRGQPQMRGNVRYLNRIVDTLREHMGRYGYESIDLPIIEDANLFLIKAGDQVINHLFTFERNGRQVALRPEFTAAASYRYITRQELPPVVRWQFSGPVFVDDPNDFSDDHQRFSIGAELLGMSGITADAEIIAMAVQGLMLLGVEDWHVTIGHAGIVKQMLVCFGLDSRTERFLLHHSLALKKPKQDVLDLFDNLYVPQHADVVLTEAEVSVSSNFQVGIVMGSRTREEIARRLAQKRKRSSERGQVVAALESLEEWGQITGTPNDVFSKLASGDNGSALLLWEWRQVVDLLSLYGIPLSRVVLQPDLARNWEYYTGIVFELDAGGFHLGGGGRYDELARLIGGSRDVPAVGFAYYLDQVVGALPDVLDDSSSMVALVVDDQGAPAATQWACRLRDNGIVVVLYPVGEVPVGRNVLTIGNGLTVQFNGRAYSPDQVKTLIADLK